MRWCSAAVLVLGSILAGCAPAPPPGNPNRVGVSVGEQAPEIYAYDLAGEPARLSDFRGKVVLVDFWQSNCPPCRVFHETERALLERFGSDRFVILGVNLDGDRQRGLRTQQREEIPWRSLHDSKGFIGAQWRVSGTPTVFLIDPQGIIRYVEEGPAPYQALESRIAKMLKSQGSQG